MSKVKSERLGMPYGSAYSRLMRMVMFDLCKKCGLDVCYRCGEKIDDLKSFSVDHKKLWSHSDDPLNTFFDISNIAFSHFKCNSGASGQKIKVNQYGYRGVTFDKRRNLYRGQVWNGKKYIKSKYCKTAREAGTEYDTIAISIFGDQALTNYKLNLLN